MFKFLFYSFLFYIGFRFLFGNLFRIKIKKFNHNGNFNNNTSNTAEGEINVDHKSVPKFKDDKSVGEYVDYEELKDTK